MTKLLRLFSLAALLLCLCAVSHAQEIAPVLQTRISLLLPAGMEEAEGSPEKKDGSIHLIIDSRATDWNRVTLQSYSPDSIEAVVAVLGPEGAAYYHYDAGNEGSDEEILSRLEDVDPQDAYEGDQVQNGTVVARMLKDYNTVVPEKPEYSSMTLYVRWYNENYQEILTEKVAFTCEHTVPGGVYAVLSEIPASLIGFRPATGFPRK